LKPRCQDIDQWLSGNRVEMPAALQEHLEECTRCRLLVDTFEKDREAEAEAPSNLGTIVTSLKKDLRPTRLLPATGGRMGWIAAALLIASGVLLALYGAPFASSFDAAPNILAVAVLAAAGAALAFSLSRQMIPAARHPVPPGLLLLLSAAGIPLAFAVLFPYERFAPQLLGLHCVLRGVLFAVPAAYLLYRVVRRGAPLNAPVVGATVGGASALASVLVLQFVCPQHNLIHLAGFHAGVVAVCIAAGYLTGLAAERLARRA
jgi:hypothetical protein